MDKCTMAESSSANTRSIRKTGARRRAFDELVNSYKVNCDAAEEASLEFLGVGIGLDNMPLINIPTLRDLVKQDFWVVLRQSKEKFTSTVENAMFLVVLTDYVTCAVRNVSLFDIFQTKRDATHGIPALLGYINKSWLRMFILSTPPNDITERQLFSVVSQLKMAVNRLPLKDYRDCFSDALHSANYQLELLNSVVPPTIQHWIAYNTDRSTTSASVSNIKRKSHDKELSYTSVTYCESPKCVIDLTVKEQVAGKNHKPLMQTLDFAPRVVSGIQNKVPKSKKPRFSSDITKYMSVTTSKKDLAKNDNLQSIVEKKILDVTSKENISTKELEIRAVTPPSMTVCDESKDSPFTPVDKPTVINMCSPIKKILSPRKTLIRSTENGQKNAFAIMMQRSKENSKRKSLFAEGSARKT